MATAVQPKRKAKKYRNGFHCELFARLRLLIAFDSEPTQMSDLSASHIESYLAKVLYSCTIAWHLPKTPLNVDAYRQCIVLPGDTPYYNQRRILSHLPLGSRDYHAVKPTHPSIIPLFMTAQSAGVDVQNYNFVSERNSFRKLTMNDKDFVITVVRFGSTLFLRRYPGYHNINKNDSGFRFEQMCILQG